MNHPRMTSRGRALAGIFGILVAISLPKRTECSYPGEQTKACRRQNVFHATCTRYEIEPLVFYGIEKLAGRDIGFAYTSGEDCR